MKSSVRIAGATLLMTLASFLVGCSSSTAPIAVTLKANPTTIDQGQPSAITATVANDSKDAGVTWGSVSSGSLSGTTTTAATYNTAASVTSQTSVTLTATSVTDTSKSGSVQITVNPLPAISTTTPPGAATSGQTYSYTLAETGGTSPFTWSVTPTLPAGLSLNASTGVVSGIPTQSSASNSSYTFKVIDATGAFQTQAFSIAVSAPPALAVTTTSLPGATVGTPYSADSLTQSGGVGPYTWALVSGPSWLSVSSSGNFSGTPTSNSGSPVAVIVSVTDSETPNKVTANSSGLSITISLAPLNITTTSLPAGAVSGAYADTVAATGGLPPYKNWSLSGQPAWLSINSSTGVLSGTPTAAGTTPSFTVSVQDSEGSPQTAQQSFTITVNAALAITTPSLGAATVGQDYSATMAASGGVTPYTWSLSNQPSWLSINSSTGALSGTPTAAGTTPSFTAQVQDSEGTTKQSTFTITVNPATSACTGTLNNGLLKGNYALLANGWSSQTTATSVAGSFVADGKGNITGGVFDVADQNKSAPQNKTFTGTYCVGSNNLAMITITPSSGNGATFAAALDASDGNGHIIDYESGGKPVSGLLRKQTTSAFSTGSITGNYAFGMVGADQSAGSFAVAGYFDCDGVGDFFGQNDIDDNGAVQAEQSFSSTGPFSVSSTTGRATVTTTSSNGDMNMVFYVVNASELLMMTIDSNTPPMIMAGQVLKQSSSLGQSSLNGTMVIEDQYLDGPTSPTAMVGLLTANDSNGSFSGSFDENDGGTLGTQTPSGTYTVDPTTGRVALSGSGVGNHPPVFYLVGPNQAFMIGTGGSPDFGTLTPQTGSSFTNSSLSGLYLGGTQEPVSWGVNTEVDSITLTNGTLTGTSDYFGSGTPQSQSINGNYCTASGAGSTTCTSSSTGRVIVCSSNSNPCPAADLEVIIYVISGSQFAVMDASSGTSSPRLTDFHQ
ncbi:MAG: putative Ig domain-containing protein [Terriglobales bacterium]